MSLPIFVLTLADSTERRRPLLQKLASMGLNYHLFFGIDGRHGLPQSCEKLIDRRARYGAERRPLTDGEYACALSHLEIYQECLRLGVARAIVLEDDALLGTSFAAFAKGEFKWVGELILLDHWRGLVDPVSAIESYPGFCAYRIVDAPYLATGYGITASGARYILERAFPVRAPSDWPCDIAKMKARAMDPRIIDHPSLGLDAGSHLEEGRVSASELEGSFFKKMKDEALRFVRKAGLKRMMTIEYWKRKWDKRSARELSGAARLDY